MDRKFILAPGNAPDDWPLLHKAALEAEELGFWAFLLPDQCMGGRDFGGDSTLDTWLALSYLAPLADNIRLGSLVIPVTLRSPEHSRKDDFHTRRSFRWKDCPGI